MISACCRLCGVSLYIVNESQEIKDFCDISSKSYISDHYNTGIIIIVTMAL